MADKAQFEVIQISKAQKPSKFKPGEMYWEVKVTDGKTGRAVTVFGDWAKDWKLGDVIEVCWEVNEYKNKEGNMVSGWKITDPNATPKAPRPYSPAPAASATPSIVNAYLIAGAIAPLLFKAKDVVKLADITALAKAVMKELQPAEVAAPAAAVAPAPVAPTVTQTPAAPVAAAPVVDTTPVVVDSDFEEDEPTF